MGAHNPIRYGAAIGMFLVSQTDVLEFLNTTLLVFSKSYCRTYQNLLEQLPPTYSLCYEMCHGTGMTAMYRNLYNKYSK